VCSSVEDTLVLILLCKVFQKYAGQSHGIKIVNSSFESVEEFKYLRTILTHQNSGQEEIN
jgi:hypothetical protein